MHNGRGKSSLFDFDTKQRETLGYDIPSYVPKTHQRVCGRAPKGLGGACGGPIRDSQVSLEAREGGSPDPRSEEHKSHPFSIYYRDFLNTSDEVNSGCEGYESPFRLVVLSPAWLMALQSSL